MTWTYAEMSKAAKQFGGPEQFLAKMCREKVAEGRLQMIPVIGAAIAIAVVGDRIYLYIKDKHQKKAEKAEEKLIEGINKYEAMGPNQQETEIEEGSNAV